MTTVEQVQAFFGRHRESRHIKLLTGMRGCGKSYALTLWINRLKLDGVKPDHILRFDLEDPKNRPLHETEPLLDAIDARMPGDEERVHVFLDEVCELEEFEAVIGVLHAQSRIDLTITCSNNRPISPRFREYLSGRCVFMPMVPPAFAEVPLPKKVRFEGRLLHVLRYGTLPYLNPFRGSAGFEERCAVYLQGLWNTILVKDILTRNRLADSRLTEKLLGRIYEHLGETESLRKIAADSTIEGREAAPNTVESYIDALDESLLVRKVPRFDAFTGETLKTGYRFYLGDLALGANRYGDFPGDPMNAIRNLIALRLCTIGGQLCCGRYDGIDFDFVSVQKGNKYTCWQFAPDIVDDAVPTPVLAPLKRVPDDVRRTVITRHRIPKRRQKGLEYITLERFLMDEASVK